MARPNSRSVLRLSAVVLAGALVVAACGESGTSDSAAPDGASPDASPEAIPSAQPEDELAANPITGDPLPPLDQGSAVVALEDVHFDTFTGGGSVPLADADDELIDRLRDAIVPIYEPDYESAETASDWLGDDDLVLGVTGEDVAFAYPYRILNFHEIVHQDVDGVPLLVSYCPLCQSGVVFDRRIGDRTLTFGNTSALYESDMVMFDWETNSYWWQVPGLAIVGDLAGETLTAVPSQTMTWSEWRVLHPETAVLSRPGPADRYDGDPFAGLPDFLDGGGEPFPLTEAARDGRLPASTFVLGVDIGGEHHVYPVELLAGEVVQETVGGEPVVIFGDEDGNAASAFIARAAGETLTFDIADGAIVDRETGSTWDRGGRATDGPLAEEELAGAPSRTTFWYASVAAFPELELRVPDEIPEP